MLAERFAVAEGLNRQYRQPCPGRRVRGRKPSSIGRNRIVLQTAAARRLSRSFKDEFLERSYGYRPGWPVDRRIVAGPRFHYFRSNRRRKSSSFDDRIVIDSLLHVTGHFPRRQGRSEQRLRLFD